LHNEASFVYENSEDTYLLSFYRRDNQEDYFNHFVVLDMDGDGIPELVLHNMYNGDSLVLHYYNGAVYGKKYGYRAMRNLKMDGFFGWSNNASNSGLGKLWFSGPEQETMYLAEYGSLLEDIEMYRINGSPVSQKDFLAYTAFQDAKEDVVWHEFNIGNLLSALYMLNAPSFPPPIDYFQYIDSTSRMSQNSISDLRFWGWSKNSNVAYTITRSLAPMKGYIFTAVIFNTIHDIFVWQDSLNSNDFEENGYTAAYNNFVNNFISRAGQNGIEFTQADFKGFPIRHNNQTVNIKVVTFEKTGEWHEVYGNIGGYGIIVESNVRGAKPVYKKTLDWPVMDVIPCGYFISPFEDRALIVIGEYALDFEGYDVRYVLTGCHLSTGFDSR
jgi:hypothetical protein